MLLANLAKSPLILKLLTLTRSVPKPLSTSPIAVDQLLDCFVKGADNLYNKHANYDYLSYLFADLAKHEEGRRHFLTPRKEDGNIIPLSKITVFTEHASTIRRRGVANTIKNVCFSVPDHHVLLSPDSVDLLPYLLLPLMSSSTAGYSEAETDSLPEECQLLPPTKKREPQADILGTHLESLLLLTSTKQGRGELRAKGVYAVVRELHAEVEDEGAREGCDRFVQVLMREEESGNGGGGENGHGLENGEPRVQEVDDEDEDDQIVDVL